MSSLTRSEGHFRTVDPNGTIDRICGHLMGFAHEKPKVKKLLNFPGSRFKIMFLIVLHRKRQSSACPSPMWEIPKAMPWMMVRQDGI